MIGGVTLSDIARKVGCDKSTVSRALRNQPGVDPKTSRRIREVAEKMGYRPDPVQAYAAARRWRDRAAGGTYAVALLMPDYRGDANAEIRRQRTEVIGTLARERLAALGCSLDVLDFAEYPSLSSLSRVLSARGIRGLIIPPLTPLDRDRLSQFDWSQFTAVGCQAGWSLPPVHVVENDEYYGVQKAWRELVSRGYRRIGPALASHAPWAEDDYLRHGAIAAERANVSRDQSIVPVFDGRTQDRDGFCRWYETHRPDAVIGFHLGMYHWLVDMGVRVPEETAFVCLHASSQNTAVAGLSAQLERIVQVAVDLLMAEIRDNLWGIPALRQRVLIEPVWLEGASLSPRT